MRIMPESSQIATILTLVMAVIFLFIVITINIGNIAQEKTMLSNVSDNAALLLASMLGSLSNGLRMKLGLWGTKDKECDFDWLLVKIIAAVGALIVSILLIAAGGIGIPGTIGATLSIIGLIAGAAGSAALFVGGVITAVQEPGSFKQAELQFRNMTFEERIKEQGIQLSLYSLVGDPNKNCVDKPCFPTGGGDPALYGGCSDPQDLDMDGDKTDCISCFAYWYTERLESLPRKGDVVQAIYDALFFNPRLLEEGKAPPNSGVKLPRIYVKRNEETWKADSYGFWIDTNNNQLADPDESADPQRKGHLTMDSTAYTDDPHNAAGVVYKHDIYFVDWLEQRFIPLVKRLHEYGYGLSPDLDKTLKDIEFLISGEESRQKGEIKEFEDGVAELYGTDFDSRLQSFEEWMAVFYNGTKEQDWSDRMQEWINKIEGWIVLLEEKRDRINDDLEKCSASGPYECGRGDKNKDACCVSHCECHCEPCPPPDDDGPEDDGPEGGGPEGGGLEAALFHNGDVKAHFAWFSGSDEKILLASNGGCSCPDCGGCECICDSACGCGPEQGGGKFCPRGLSGSPCGGRPTYANTPSGKNCCDTTYMLHYQVCDAGTHPTGGGGPCDGPCSDTYHDCEVDHNLNHITREHAVEYLEQFVADVKALAELDYVDDGEDHRGAFQKGYEDAQLKASDPRLYEALYEWEDYAGRKGEMTNQRVKHAVYVRLSDDLKPNDKDPKKGFQLPYPHQYREWGWPSFGNRKCTSVMRERGDFGIVVARYDQDVGTAPESPFKKFWIFKTRQTTGESDVPQNILNRINNPQPCALDAQGNKTINAFCVDKETADWVLRNGIVSATKGYYGPGYTFTKEQIKARDPNIFKASEINKDIKIERANWKDFIKD